LRGDLLERQVLCADVHQRLPAEVPPALIEDRAQLTLALIRKGFMQIAHGQPVARSEDTPRGVAESISPPQDCVPGHAAGPPGDRAIERVLAPLDQHAFLAAAHTLRTMRSRSSITNSIGTGMTSSALIFTASFSVVTIGAPWAALRISSMSRGE